MTNVRMSPEKEQEIASKILQRAELAQMTRQLKLGLSRVPTPKLTNALSRESSNLDDDTASKKRSSNDFPHGDRESNDLDKTEDSITNTSPLKKRDIVKANQSHSSSSSSSLDSEAIPSSSSTSTSNDNDIMTTNRTLMKSPIRAASPPITTTNIPRNVPSTPGRHASSGTFMTPKRGLSTKRSSFNDSNNNHETDSGADLLMYLATSPYVSARRNSIQKGTQVLPTTPSHYYNISNSNNNNDPVRFSSIKPSISSPQSTFKVPPLISNNTNSNNTLSFDDVLMASPSIFSNNTHNNTVATALTQQKKTPSKSDAPSTPSRELTQQTNLATQPMSSNVNNINAKNLLKTPNFNMGDYIHNLFSPSPNFSFRRNSLTNFNFNQDLGK
ncbi:hypothetical protein KAFR_0A08450 [Kazachstania africana CBS 2517]|uniref:Uncharacterized protein n=1 Tax=Kazachstania africana (strain ATCC 22294 / BCRC 22015 / CBS 2517 / CECT 1963 / NBRC 1671 / NRRL Y-8276) TaxID=1071382 RepID=H2APH9_KAZAF|nr:hypothetical protein KAFR_0A08450 [Kazachstania africana CBS 2517]CCF56279.1 hypothetical protein KAFR_0A08450 [Kazachstania africana CBS 2517]